MTYSWEIGTLAEALTEYEWSWLGVFAPGSIPPPSQLADGQAADVLSIAEKCACLAFRISRYGIGSRVVLMRLAGGCMQGRRGEAT